jgi:hypothetical protein
MSDKTSDRRRQRDVVRQTAFPQLHHRNRDVTGRRKEQRVGEVPGAQFSEQFPENGGYRM